MAGFGYVVQVCTGRHSLIARWLWAQPLVDTTESHTGGDSDAQPCAVPSDPRPVLEVESRASPRYTLLLIVIAVVLVALMTLTLWLPRLLRLLALVLSGFLGSLCVGVSVVVQMVSERLVDNVGNSRVVEVRLSSGEVYSLADLAAVPTSTAPMPAPPVDYWCTLGVLYPRFLS